jgi:hypothetical protein
LQVNSGEGDKVGLPRLVNVKDIKRMDIIAAADPSFKV